MEMELPAPASVAVEGPAVNTDELPSSSGQETKDLDPRLPVVNGWHAYGIMKNGKPRPTAVRDYPDGLLTLAKAKQQSRDVPDDVTVSRDKKQVSTIPAIAKDKKEKKKIRDFPDASAIAKEDSGKKAQSQGENKKQPLDSPAAVRTPKEKDVHADVQIDRAQEGIVTETEGLEVNQKKPAKIAKSVVKRTSAIATTQSDVSVKEVEQERVKNLQGEIEKTKAEKTKKGEIEQQKDKKRQGETEQVVVEKTKETRQVKRKSGIRDLPEVVKLAKPNLAPGKQGDAWDHLTQNLDLKREDPEASSPSARQDEKREPVAEVDSGVKESVVVDNAKVNGSGKKKRPLEDTTGAEKSKKISKPKPSSAAQPSGKRKEADSNSKAQTQAKAVTPKATKVNNKPSTAGSGKKVRRSVGKVVKPPATAIADLGNAKKALVESLRLFDAVRRKFVQDEEKNGKQGRGTRADLQTASLIKDHGLSRAEKNQGSIPGVDVGDIFLFRTEISFARVHGPIQGGIEYLTTKDSEWNTPVAIGIISNVGQDGEDSGEELIYTGQGGRSADNKQIADQKLERGNLAMDGSKRFNVPVRLIRGIKDVNSPSGKIYIYDGLYAVEDRYTTKGSGGFDEFKFRLRRMPDQPELGSNYLKLANDLKNQSPSSRKDVVVTDISKGKESQPICIENTIDDDKGPTAFEYSTKLKYPDGIDKLESPAGCNCKGACTPSNDCSCFSRNGDELPYLNSGFLVREKDYIFECGSQCSCSSSCQNRATQKGLKFRLDVFKTVDRGWGVRSLEMIAAGSFVCEYTGKLVADEETINAVSNREHILDARRLPHKMPRWGDVPSFFPDRPSSDIMPELGNPEFIIDASHTGNVARFINHSCSPNLLVQKVLSEHSDVRFPQIKLFAMDNIPPLRELTFDYGYPADEELASEEKSIVCLCGSSDCRGKLYL